MTDAPAAPASGAPLAIIAGGGQVPVIVAEAARRVGRPPFVFGIVGEADRSIEAFPHAWLKWGEIGRLFDLIARHGAREAVLVGGITRRPDFTSIRLDFGAIRSLPEILSIVIGGDDTVLTGTVRFFEARGIGIVGAHEIAPELVAGHGPIGRIAPGRKNEADIAAAMEAARTIGRLDVGQAAIAVGGRAVALEGVEGTDGLVSRTAALHTSGRLNWKGRAGVLAKCAKPQQDLRVDMPAIGVRTVEAVAAADLAGIVVETGRVMIVDRPAVIKAADAAGIFVTGIVAAPASA
ncbi:MAG TPA: UDP-2,3-diacylglucosamine diphosphatase LpxI [Kaistiaceae bacterium]|nr:UDP-2,3-diacylglucosamine diphosphatase LpxI [Kaistiaceae bacterium]